MDSQQALQYYAMERLPIPPLGAAASKKPRLRLVQVAKEFESGAHLRDPGRDVHWGREVADGFGREHCLGQGPKDLVGVPWLVPEAVVDDVAPDLERSDSSDERFVDG